MSVALASLAGVALLAFLLSVAFLSGSAPENKRDDLAAEIQSAVAEARVGETLSLRRLIPETFDAVAIVPPYADNAAVNRELGIEWNAESAPAYRSEAWVDLLFIEDGNVVAWCAIPRTAVDSPTLRGPFVVVDPVEFKVEAAESPFGKGLVPIR